MVLESSLINVLHPNPSFSMTRGLRVNFLAHIWDIYEYGWDIYECISDIYEKRWLYCPHRAGSAPYCLRTSAPCPTAHGNAGETCSSAHWHYPGTISVDWIIGITHTRITI